MRASSSFAGLVSTATLRPAPTATDPNNALRPTPPSPTTATDAPAGTRAVLTTAPTPVITAQPKIAATSGGTSGSIRTTELGTTTARSANAEIPL